MDSDPLVKLKVNYYIGTGNSYSWSVVVIIMTIHSFCNISWAAALEYQVKSERTLHWGK